MMEAVLTVKTEAELEIRALQTTETRGLNEMFRPEAINDLEMIATRINPAVEVLRIRDASKFITRNPPDMTVDVHDNLMRI